MTRLPWYALWSAALLFAPALPLSGQEGVVEEAVLTMSLGDSLIAVDSLRRSPGRLVSKATSLHRARFLLEADLGPDGGIERLHIVIRPWDRGPDGEPAVDVTVLPVGELLMLEEPEGAVLREIEAGTFPYVSPSLAFIEQEILHARAVSDGRDEVHLPVWSPYGNDDRGRTWTETVRFVSPDSVRLSGWEDVVSTYRIDADGRILSGRMEPQGYEIRRSGGGR